MDTKLIWVNPRPHCRHAGLAMYNLHNGVLKTDADPDPEVRVLMLVASELPPTVHATLFISRPDA